MVEAAHFGGLLARPRVRELVSLVPTSVGFVVLHETGLLAEVPLWLYLVSLWAAYGVSRLTSLAFPRDSPDWKLWPRTLIVTALATYMIYLTGWGPMLTAGYVAVAADQVNSCGARVLRPIIVWSLAGVTAGQLAIAAGLAPTRIAEPLVHGVAVMAAVALVLSLAIFALFTRQKEASERTAQLLLALAEDLAAATTEAEVCERIADAVVRLVGLARVVVSLWDPANRTARAVAMRGFSAEEVALIRNRPVDPAALPGAVDAARRGRPFVVTPDMVAAPMLWLGAVEVLVAPIVARGDVLGTISASRTEGRPRGLSGEIGARLAGIAAQTAAGLERARLIARERAVAEELRAADRAKSEFLAVVSHELRTPIAVTLGAARTLHWRADELDERTRTELAESIVRRAEQLDRLVNDLLLSAGDLSLELGDVDLCALARSAAADARSLYPDAVVRAEVCDEPVVVRGDPFRLRQVIDNLVGNAVKYAPGATVVVRAGRNGDTGWFSVGDDGPGMPEAVASRAFEPFFQADASNARRAGGLGLGLHICRRIVEAHGGTISLDTAPGRGTTATVRLPVQQPQ